ncbi:hypothetical protein QBC35DRAFT_510595 [Podospora australis]|uniref:Uncharacterized protein n=1 Tax=Podospora australis TaxID=1536484 RepID=A0AAN6WI91_9PEZI|nr:hypothetical protein QBC35DRAFT_510595 [Podospora australis]
MQSTPVPERRCYCGKRYQTVSSLGRHSRACPASLPDCKHLLELLAYMEPQPIPGDLFHRALLPLRTWNENGNETRERVFQLPAMFASTERLDAAVKNIIDTSAVKVSIGSTIPDADQAPLWAYRDLELPESSRTFLRNSLESQDSDCRELEAARLVFNGFPIPDLDANFVQNGRVFFPLVVPQLQRLPMDKLLEDELPRMVEICISVSYFGDHHTKNKALALGQAIASRIALSPLALSVQLRQITLSLLNGKTVSFSLLPKTDRKGNSQRAEALLLHAQQAIEHGRISEAWALVKQWTPLYAAQPSSLENIMTSRLDYMKGKLHRFQGHFEVARRYFEPLFNQYPPPREQFSSGLHLIAIYSELGLWEKAKAVIDKIQIFTDRQRRLHRLAQAELSLSRGLCEFPDDLGLAKELFAGLANEYDSLVPCGKTMRRNFFRVCFGLAVIGHLKRQGQPEFGVVRCLNEWKLAYEASRGCLVAEEGFPDLVCHLSMAQVKSSFREPGPDLRQDLERTQQIWSTLSSQTLEQRFFFTNLGTRWVDMVSEWLEQSGMPRIVPPWRPSTVREEQ